MIDKQFIIAGKAIFTIEVPQNFIDKNPDCKPHYTYCVSHAEKTDKWPERWFVGVLVGPNNTKDYKPVSFLDPKTGEIEFTHNGEVMRNSWPMRLVERLFVNLWAGTPSKVIDAGFNVHHCGYCGRCGLPLTTPESCEKSFGPECRRILGIK